MRVETWERLGLSYPKVVLISASVGLAPAALVAFAGSWLLGQLAGVLAGAMGIGIAYLVAAAPKREWERSARLQAAESPTLAASAAVYLESSSSISKTLLSLESRERRLGTAFRAMRRRLLLGGDPLSLAGEVGERASSVSVGRVLRAAVNSQTYRLQEEGNELEGMMQASALGEETKTPIFIAVAFFVPIMSLLFAAISRTESPAGLLGLALLDVFLLDLVLSLSATDRVVEEH